ncbi:hypothetical protein BCR44DRAFT_1425161 [Catenaria anguillulae PL171]|uniref:Uncharacterized protein n=1 Tax=Catenaria anguillulae PL171 TaxID=765915 RepID=A0A1Y2I2N8_9FUNG|nr:hypothetical protein BCR44DRAFT_1425161 [Catenaria anguillulae PL171]
MSSPTAMPSLPAPLPEWGPDTTSQQATGTTARSWFGSLCYLLSNIDPQHPNLLLSRVSQPDHWTPALLAALHDHLQHAAPNDPMAAWAIYNTLLEKALLTRNIPLIRTCLNDHRWHLCMDNDAPTLVLETKQSCRQILPLLLADPRFAGKDEGKGESRFLRFIVNTAVGRSIKDDCILTSILETPTVDPWIVWHEALQLASQSFRSPNVWVAGKSELVDPQWQPNHRVPPARPGVACAKLLMDMPEAIQLKLHTKLDASSIGRIRSTCHALSATRPGYSFSADRFQSLLDYALAARRYSDIPGQDLVGRVLVESARHSTNPDYSLDLLSQLDHATNRTTASMYLTWTLHTLLTFAHLPTSAATGALLVRILLHPRLPLAAWSLVIFNHQRATTMLANASPSQLSAGCPVADDPQPVSHVYLRLISTRSFPPNWHPTPEHFADLFHLGSTSRIVRAPSIATLQLLALATLTESTSVLDALRAFHVRIDQNMKWIILCHALEACSIDHVARVVAHVEMPAHAVRVALIRMCQEDENGDGERDAMGNRSTDSRSRRMRLVDILLAHLSKVRGEIRVFLVQVKFAEAMELKCVRARAMWWWLQVAAELAECGVDDLDSSEWEEVAKWIEAEIKWWDKTDRIREFAVQEHEWVGDLKLLWKQSKKQRRQVHGDGCLVQ